MNAPLAELCRSFTEALEKTDPMINPASPYLRVAEEILEMAFAYLEDGVVFYRRGDPVNALAAWCYGYGWLDAGANLGILIVPSLFREIPGLHGSIPSTCIEHLDEKTERYQRMLHEACLSIEDAPDVSSPVYPLCSIIRDCVEEWHMKGEAYHARQDSASALAAYSYAYGWLDCGVRAGLFRITGDRHLFTA
ncbi:MAG: hypothetical protein XE11_0420 [Methanomicrobiales archaeon 53_19]|jgi:hypothetical protein|uniref:DUF357 domain-containing protein n=1 Tax=Methanocalculus sp. TaxID=2004547 RepID=UPI0007463AA1|nr:DUF357 domain-containing protein [Methanocalculus sp.]KUK70193.1 MAG: hypothetical protein XD88_0798 [Methanocalculus sp. 52_23]KUL04640.1 MAG: hypothetical protein XE11_0420 [Methanomicrobiales archaeon 53_19]